MRMPISHKMEIAEIDLAAKPCNCYGRPIDPVFNSDDCSIGYKCGKCGHVWPNDQLRRTAREHPEAKPR